LIADKLQRKKVDADITQQVVSQRQKNEFPDALQLARHRLKSMNGLPVLTMQRRLGGLLSRRGFDDETVRAVFERLQLAEPQSD
jgi:SOS response regulatory protein OraA/RecX